MRTMKILAAGILFLAVIPSQSKAVQIWMGGFISCTIVNVPGNVYQPVINCGKDPNTECARRSGINLYVNGDCVFAGLISIPAQTPIPFAKLVSEKDNPDGTKTITFVISPF